MKEIYFAGGCFWGTEHFFKQIEGVTDTETGFANGHTERPTYKEVYTDTTGFAETVRVAYDPSRVSLRFLLRMFFKAIDPTSLNRQGHDEGTRYRTGIYFTDPADLPLIEGSSSAGRSPLWWRRSLCATTIRRRTTIRTTWTRTPTAIATCRSLSSPSPERPRTRSFPEKVDARKSCAPTGEFFRPYGKVKIRYPAEPPLSCC